MSLLECAHYSLQRKSFMTSRNSRADGKVTRQHILEVAAELFAEQGYAYTTSKEICQKANTNIAAVNYYFGSKDKLYDEVLLEMHDRLITVDTLNHILHDKLDAKEKLSAVFDELMKNIIERKWHARMYIREMLSPTVALDSVLTQKILPKFSLIREIVSEITDIPIDDPAVMRCLLSVIAPNAVLLVAGKGLTDKLLPKVHGNYKALSNHLKSFALAGLDAIAKEYKAENNKG